MALVFSFLFYLLLVTGSLVLTPYLLSILCGLKVITFYVLLIILFGCFIIVLIGYTVISSSICWDGFWLSIYCSAVEALILSIGCLESPWLGYYCPSDLINQVSIPLGYINGFSWPWSAPFCSDLTFLTFFLIGSQFVGLIKVGIVEFTLRSFCLTGPLNLLWSSTRSVASFIGVNLYFLGCILFLLLLQVSLLVSFCIRILFS